MFERKYSKFLTIILIIIIVAVIGLLGYLGYDYYSKYSINKSAGEYVDTFIEEPSVDRPEGTTQSSNNSTVENIATNPETETNSNSTNTINSSSTSGKKQQYYGFDVLGTIEIPKTNVKYPILAKVTKKSLEKSVAVVWPEDAVLNTVGNVVIVGHNYRNGLFFSNNKKLSKGDKIYIKDLDGNRVTYIIYNIFETTDTDTTFYNRDTDGKREITLSTCTDDSSARLIIEAREE